MMNYYNIYCLKSYDSFIDVEINTQYISINRHIDVIYEWNK